MIKRYFKSLESKIIFFGVLLSLVSITLTTATNYLVSNRLILKQFERVNGIATGAAVEKTNTYLGEIAWIINMSMKNDFFNTFMSADSQDAYQLAKASKDYKEYLDNLIIYNDKIDSLMVVDQNSNVFICSSNTVSVEYSKYNSDDFKNYVKALLVKNQNSQFFLDRYEYDKYERTAVICPVYDPNTENLRASIIIVLSEKLTKEIQFVGDNFYITDNAGNSAVIVNKKEAYESTDRNLSLKRELNFEGWKITGTFTFEKLQKLIGANLHANIKLGILSLIITAFILLLAGKIIVKPIKNMEEQISKLNHFQIESKPVKIFSRKIGFKPLLLLLYSIIVTIPVVLITGSSYLMSRNAVESKIGSVFEYSADILYQQIGFIFNNSNKLAVEISIVNNSVQRLMNDISSPDAARSMQDVLNDITMTNNMLGRNISNISIFDANYKLICSTTYGSPFMLRSDITNDLKYISEHFGTPMWKNYTEVYFNTNGFRVGMQVRGVPDGREAGKLLGFILIDFKSDEIQKMLGSFQQFSDVEVYLTDETWQSILKNNNIDHNILEEIKRYMGGQRNRQRVSFRQGGNSYLMINKEFNENNWKLIFLLKNFNENKQILYYNIGVLAGLLLLSFAFSYGVSSVLSFNISSLIKTVRKVKSGNLAVRFQRLATDEISELGQSFNEMLERLNQLIEDKYISEVKVKDAEIKAKEYELNLLQSQINPHFLYNTLKTAQYMVFAKDPRAEKMINLLISLFKNGITRGEKLVKLRQEIDYVRTYIDIQQMRFSDKFKVSIDIAEELMDYSVLKLTIQPIVENAIYHGLEVLEGEGYLAISAYEQGMKLKITVCDTGAGMNVHKLEEIRNQLAGLSMGKSIGIINVNERIKLHFGEGYGIEVESTRGRGSLVTLSFPLIRSDDVRLENL